MNRSEDATSVGTRGEPGGSVGPSADDERTGAGALEGTPCAPPGLPTELSWRVRVAAGAATTAVFGAVALGNALSQRAGAASFRSMGLVCACVGAGMVLGGLARKNAGSIVRAHFVAAWLSALVASGVWMHGTLGVDRGQLVLFLFATGSFATLLSAGITALSASFLSAAESVSVLRSHDGRDQLLSGAGVGLAWLTLPLWAGSSLGPLALAGVLAGAALLLRSALRDAARLRFLRVAYDASEGDPGAPREWRVCTRFPWAGAAPPGVRQVFTELGANMGLLVRTARSDIGPFRESTSEVAAALVPVTYAHAKRLMRWRYLRSTVSLSLATGFHGFCYLMTLGAR